MSDNMENTEAEIRQDVADEAAEAKSQGKTFSQEELERIVEQRLMRERKKFQKQTEGIDLEEAKRLLEEKEQAEIQRQKERGEFEEVLKKTVSKKDEQITQYKTKLQEIQVDGSLLQSASQLNAVNPDQVVQLVKNQVRLSEDGQVEVVDNKGTIRYSDAGEPMKVQDLMSEFLTANPHFVKASPGGVGSQGAAGGSTQKPTSVADMLANWENGGKEAYAQSKGKR